MSFSPLWNRCRRRGSNPGMSWSSTTGVLTRWPVSASGAQLLCLPPYSPDFNPIETACSKLKQQLRGVKARVLEQLEPAIADALSAITAQNARAFFRNCGHGIQQL